MVFPLVGTEVFKASLDSQARVTKLAYPCALLNRNGDIPCIAL
ncbi:hypothetical protein OHAE_3972 [Ochrobactrum soli]|uniref:Uncharacterized protein n=1 Tax=Ochrobactrum soli TaxID=2448455 RepID=A0A2P9HJR7_9HYPH|nr:hypothetical protein OHAE_3972 [[Ochrobactrum] soli]